ncbi:sulfurtransferase [Microbacterium dextranolyticum]|uniref:Sulfurtransferase n=1 Tax=Microbacterium dextranolyticum TaxID=36806 RepID=A0A9W6HPH1_9MICO|nr:sulfurtransferase [Microbacterium dextranolyticum]MBM7464059.1 thiosulfate/3-mercaptopyruvate sulfurtransferase [Microbacterium dextranolyticum]GLJ96612.1 sulfurtransferase [Microbacterium dextranolyticum]
MTDHLITAAELDAALRAGAAPVVLDVRWRLGGPDGHPDYRAGHIPGAVFVRLDDDLAAHGHPFDGRHPLPEAAAFQASARRWGIDDGDTVVVYDDWQGYGAARAWWMLRDAGVDARVLDGGLAVWRAAGLPLEQGEILPVEGGVTLQSGRMPQLTIDEAASLAASPDGVLLDARAGERYRGETEPIDPRAGHVPGAISAPTSENVNGDGTLRSPDELQARFAALGVGGGRVGVYCGSGVSAAQEVLALAVAGHKAALYPGSWSQWANTPGRPVATGDQP